MHAPRPFAKKYSVKLKESFFVTLTFRAVRAVIRAWFGLQRDSPEPDAPRPRDATYMAAFALTGPRAACAFLASSGRQRTHSQCYGCIGSESIPTNRARRPARVLAYNIQQSIPAPHIALDYFY